MAESKKGEKLMFFQEKQYFTTLLENINLMTRKRGLKRKAFISYAWEAKPEDNEVLQSFLKRLQTDLQKAGIEVFLDVADMTGDMASRMKTNIASSHVALVIGTPRFFERASQEATNVAFEVRHILSRAAERKLQVMPVLRQGEQGSSFVPSLLTFPVRDFREPLKDERYMDLLFASGQSPQALIPAILGLGDDDVQWVALLKQAQKATAPLSSAQDCEDSIQHAVKVASVINRPTLEVEKSREVAANFMRMAKLAEECEAITMAKTSYQYALPRLVDGYGDDSGQVREVKAIIEALGKLRLDPAKEAAGSQLYAKRLMEVPKDPSFKYSLPVDALDELMFKAGNLAKSVATDPLGGKRRVFIYHIPVPGDRDINTWLQYLRCDLERAFITVVNHDASATYGTFLEEVGQCRDVIIVGTPELKKRASEPGVAKQLAFLTTGGNEGRFCLFPLLRTGDFTTSFPPDMLKFLIRDFRDDSIYDLMLVQLKDPLGVIPAIWDYRAGHHGYTSMEHQYYLLRAVPANLAGILPRSTTPRTDTINLGDPRTMARTRALFGEASAFKQCRDMGDNPSALVFLKTMLETNVQAFVDGFGETHERTLLVKQAIKALNDGTFVLPS